MKLLTLILGLGLAISAAGCAGASAAKARGASDLNCPERQLDVISGDMGSFTVKGCGKTGYYSVRGGEVLTEEGGFGMPELHGGGPPDMGRITSGE